MWNEAKKTRRGQKSTQEEDEVKSDCENIPEPISKPLSVRLDTGRDEFFLRGGEFLQHKYLRLIHEANINAIWAFALFRACVNPISRGPLQCQGAPALYQSQESTPYSYTSSEKRVCVPELGDADLVALRCHYRTHIKVDVAPAAARIQRRGNFHCYPCQIKSLPPWHSICSF